MIELEDARLATPLQIANRKDKAALLNTHLDGFTLTQLLDKVNQWCLKPRHKPFCLGYRGTFGTLLAISKHLAAFFPAVTLVASVEPESVEPIALRRLNKDNPNIAACIVSNQVDGVEIVGMFMRIDALVLAPYHDLKHKRFKPFFQELFKNPLLFQKPCIIADIVKARKYDPRGEYYMGSCVWLLSENREIDLIEAGHFSVLRQPKPNPALMWQKQQPAIEKLVAITSFSPLEKHVEVQKQVLESWLNLGLTVVSGNAEAECKHLQDIYPQVTFKPVGLSTAFSRATPRIRELMSLGGDLPVLLINSDIAIYGDQKLIVDAVNSNKPFAGIRHNWEEHPGYSEREAWGIDVFLLFPSQIATYADLGLAIGQPYWDYWVPYHLEQNNIEFDWIGEPYFYHKKHAINWDEASHTKGRRIFEKHYGDALDWSDWRRSRPYGGMI
jgi:hypothetical protein